MDHWTPQQCILPIIALHCFNIRSLGAREVDGENYVKTVEQILLDKFAITGHVIENTHRTGKRSADDKYLLSTIGNAPNLYAYIPPVGCE